MNDFNRWLWIGCLIFSLTGYTAESTAGGLEINAALSDQGDKSKEGSLAWHITTSLKDKGKPIQIFLSGSGIYEIKTDLTVPENVTLTIQAGATIHLGPKATLTINRDLEIKSDTHIYGDPGARIISTVSGNPHDYYGILKTSKTEPVKNIRIEGIKFSNTEAIGLYALAVNQGGGENIQVTDCECEGCGIIFAMNVKRITLNDNTCHSSTLDKKKLFDDHHDGIYLGGVVEDCIIKNNRVLGRRCHGIAVVSEDIYGEPTKNPEREMKGKRILVEGNTVSPGTIGGAGGIWFSCVQDCRVVNNHVEKYGDVGIDFEGCRNCIANSNILINNNKNMALYGNCKNITFSNNTVYMTREGDEGGNQSCAFMNTYSNGYSGHTDLRNTDIFVIGNTFSTNTKNPPKGWTGGIVAGTAKRIYFKDNVFINCHFESHFCHDLETIEIANNSFFTDGQAANIPLFLAVAENDPKQKQPTKHWIIRGNRFRSINDAKVSSIIQIATQAVIHGKPTLPFCDLNVVIENNIIERQTTTLPGIVFEDNYRSGHRKDMAVRCVVRNNVTNAKVVFNIPEEQRPTVKMVVGNNAGIEKEKKD